jgi:hypothetical protein
MRSIPPRTNGGKCLLAIALVYLTADVSTANHSQCRPQMSIGVEAVLLNEISSIGFAVSVR